MDDVLHGSLSREPDTAGNVRGTVENLLWFALEAFLLLALFQIVSGVLGRNLIVFTNGSYLAASSIYVAGLLLAHQESIRPADRRYPYGYGNRAAVFQLVSFCVLGAANIYLLFRILTNRGAVLGGIDLGTFLTLAVALGASVLVYKKFLCVCQEVDSQDLEDLDMVLKGAIIVSGIALAAVIWRWFFGAGTLALWAAVSIIIITLCLFVKGFHQTFLVITDRSVSSGSVRNITGFVQRAAGEAHIVDVKTRNVGNVTHIEVRAAFPRSWTIAEANAIELDIERVLRRKVRKAGQVMIYWQA